ncbi:hypothetical protein [Legionella impletisoli]|uniref:Tyrosine specific protein phosphatases domain-containing protein n=2 Tax=Bacteria TaxID=2 RepID=A0A917JRJ9_9GAMM|nr:hypothetical protein [Legionella impletisoli]GGI80375.1 hypothetical protein GCM10007966_06110 [Legionella impletisoli]
MPQTHSERYQQLVTADKSRLNVDALVSEIKDSALPSAPDGEGVYDHLVDLFREHSDAQFGIVSKLNERGEWVRDATESIPLSQRISHTAPVIEANNTLLRCLSRLRPIDYVLSQKYSGDKPGLRKDIKNQFAQLVQDILTEVNLDKSEHAKQRKFKKLEKEFDTFLIRKLHEANLTEGCETEKDCKKLLSHYRILSSLLIPARPLITLTYDAQNKVFQRETQYPVTEKTEKQKKALQTAFDLNPYPVDTDKTAQTVQALATQKANAFFAELMTQDDRALPAQSRKIHLVGARNAFIVKNELFFGVERDHLEDAQQLEAFKEDTLWMARTGVPVYVGKGETAERIQEHTRENLKQIRQAALKRMPETPEALKLHLTTLNTNMRHENQHIMIPHLYQATRDNPENEDDLSYIPVNLLGTFSWLDLAPSLAFESDEHRPTGIAPLAKATRAQSAVEVMLKACDSPNTLNVVHCASGQDRTGTVVEKTTQIWMAKRYQEQEPALDPNSIQSMRAEGGNAAEIASHHISGSPGMKTVSKSGDTFTDEASAQFYRKSADLNLSNPVGSVTWLREPSEEAKKAYHDQLAAFEARLNTLRKELKGNKNNQKLFTQGSMILEQVRDIYQSSRLSAKEVSDLTWVLSCSNRAISEPKDEANIRKLAGLSKEVSGHASPKWRKLGAALAIFACVALVVAGVLAAIPSGGTSLLLAVAGGVGLKAGITGVAASGVVGLGLFHKSKSDGLAKSVEDLQTTLKDLNKR